MPDNPPLSALPERPYTREALERVDIAVLDRLAFGVNDGDLITVRPDQVRIRYPCDLENPEARFAKDGMAWARSVDLSEPIDLSVAEDGGYDLEDGHHRWFAATRTHRPLTAVLRIKGNPVRRLLRLQEAEATAPAPKPERRRRGPTP
jgi:hypothetical protein